ncbi:Golgi resident protein GCP60-like [Saccoglossus kowalevskii]|uniref:Golgi resident protein GCP60-like n=1 Tax=Saccoglossus kowalevskii TaxID=10224 RepID=A0ABM0H0Z7_SACKO|nr:PREDICTED: Golgi resident protein GCP60-like [Saccoglossus kowalevskii]
MATDLGRLEATVDGLTINVEEDPPSTASSTTLTDMPDFEDKWGFTVKEMYRLSLQFYREMEGKVVHLSYKDKLKLVAYCKQVSHGKCDPNSSPPVGVLDVIGNDRRKEWLSLGDMSKETAMQSFCILLDKRCPQLNPWIEAHKREKDEQERKRRIETERRRHEEEEQKRSMLEDQSRKQAEEERLRQEQQRIQIKQMLDQQTYPQFAQYALQQYPNNQEQQQVLIKQLQENYFQQYMQQVYQQQLQLQQKITTGMNGELESPQQVQTEDHQKLQSSPATVEKTCQSVAMGAGDMPNAVMNGQHHHHDDEDVMQSANPQVNSVEQTELHVHDARCSHDRAEGHDDVQGTDGSSCEESYPPIANASMWTRPQIKEFKDQLRKDPESVIKVGRGETVTVRVPTHEDGTCLFWEFTTDHYDVGFGLYFEWSIAPSNAISVHVSESSDEEDDLDDEEGERGDLERGGRKDDRPPTDEIIPVYRRDCHEEVYAGSHVYPGRGVYLLKFDNSYSLFRSKTLYYRVYYTR